MSTITNKQLILTASVAVPVVAYGASWSLAYSTNLIKNIWSQFFDNSDNLSTFAYIGGAIIEGSVLTYLLQNRHKTKISAKVKKISRLRERLAQMKKNAEIEKNDMQKALDLMKQSVNGVEGKEFANALAEVLSTMNFLKEQVNLLTKNAELKDKVHILEMELGTAHIDFVMSIVAKLLEENELLKSRFNEILSEKKEEMKRKDPKKAEEICGYTGLVLKLS